LAIILFRLSEVGPYLEACAAQEKCQQSADAPGRALPPAVPNRGQCALGPSIWRRDGKIDALGGGIAASSPADFGRLIAVEPEKWGGVVKFAGNKPD
jgi:hypothetical protein